MSATTATLDTYELLEHIIAYLPPKDITKAQRVSKTWRDLIQGSKNINAAHVLQPQTDIIRSSWRSGGVYEPIYLSKARMCFHPILASYSYAPTYSHKHGYQWTITIMIPTDAIDNISEAPDAMLTDPPISNAQLFYSEYGDAWCEMRSPTGIKVMEVLQVAKSMLSTEFKYCTGHSKLKKMCFSLEIGVFGAQPQFQYWRD